MLKKKYHNLSADGTPVEDLPKVKKTRKKADPVASAKKAKAKSLVKPRLSDVFTFRDLIDDYDVKMNHGFLYKLTLTHPNAPGIERYYIGKKGFETGSDWRYYQSSSEKVMSFLNAGWVISYEVLSYHRGDWELGQAEIKAIARSWATEAQRDVSLNFGIPSGRKSMSRYMWCKKYMNQIDKRF